MANNAPSQETQNSGEKSYQPSRAQNNIRIGGRGPGRNLEVEKPKDGRQTLGRLLHYFSSEKSLIAGLLLVVVFLVLCSVFAPKLQSNAIDKITDGEFDGLPMVLGIMVILYIISAFSTLIQSRISAFLSQRIVRRMSNSHSMITHLPKGYDTELTESGQNLSQGQRQLLSIGRAFLAQPRILILNEATSSVDTRNHEELMAAKGRYYELYMTQFAGNQT